MLKYIVLSCFLLGLAAANRVSHKECASDKDGYVKINVIDVRDAIKFPSNVSAGVDIDVLKAFPQDARIQLQVYRVIRFFGRDRHIKIPCISRAGSCEYDVCSFLMKQKRKDGSSSFDLCSVWPQDKECSCPIGEMSLRRPDASLSFPDLPGIAKLLVSGKYAVNAKFIDPSDQKSFFCLDLEATLG